MKHAGAAAWRERALALVLLAAAAAALLWAAERLPLLDTLVFGYDWHNYWAMVQGGWPDYGAVDVFNPPWTVLLLWPLAALPFKTGWAALTLLTLAVLVASVPRRADGRLDYWLLAALFTSYWVLRQLAEGNLAGLMVAGVLLLLSGLERRDPWRLAAGGLLATAKYQESWLLLLIVAGLVARTWPARRWLTAAGLGLAAVTPSLLLLGGPWLHKLLTPAGFSPNIARLTGNISLTALTVLPGFPPWGAAVASVIVLAATGWVVWRSAPAFSRLTAGFLIAASLLTAPYTGGASLTTLLAVGWLPFWRGCFWPGLALWAFANLSLWPLDPAVVWRWPDVPQVFLILWLWAALGAALLASARPDRRPPPAAQA